MMYNKLTRIIEECDENIFAGKTINPKRDDVRLLGPLHMVSYAREKEIEKVEPEISRFRFEKEKEMILEEMPNEKINIYEVSKLCRIKSETLFKLGFKEAKKYTKDEVTIVEIKTAYGIIKPLVFPMKESNIGIFINQKGETSYVADGRCRIDKGRVYLKSSNQEAIEKFLELTHDENLKYIPSLEKVLSKELWQLDDNDEDNNSVKSIMWIGYTKYCNFPVVNGKVLNIIWDEESKTGLYEKCKNNMNLRKYIDYASLSQTGISAVAGPIETCLRPLQIVQEDKMGNDLVDINGNIVTIDKNYVRLGEVEQFKGTKGKLNVRANQGNKLYKQSNYQGRCLVVLAEIKLQNDKYAHNLMGNCISTKEAFDSYCSDLTRDNMKQNRMSYPAHKIFIECNGEPVRIKGATNILDMKATLENGNTENKIVVLPPREFNPNGTIEEDISKFEHLCKYRDEESHLQMVQLEVDGKIYDVPGLYCDIYEDAMHSAVTSLKMKPQNIFYYGSLFYIYLKNGRENMRKAITMMLDQDRVNRAMNFARISKSEITDEISADEYINSL